MMSKKQRRGVIGAMIALFLLSVVMAADLGPKHEEYLPPQSDSAIEKTPFQALVPALLGFREIMASLLWIRTDDYFHRGEYGPIIRMVKLITTIDPHQIDVYATGAWHMAYNFMDKRLIDEALVFLEDGVKNNSTIYDLYFESGYTHMDKTKNFPEAIRWYREAETKKTTDGKPAPLYVSRQLAHAYENAGLIDESLKQWEKSLREAEAQFAKNSKDFAATQNRDTARKNLDMTRWRINDRRDNAQDQADMQLQYTVKRIAPRKLLIEGTINALDLSRVFVRFRDKDWEQIATLSLDERMQRATLEWDSVQVRQGKFKWTLDLNKDPADMGRPPETIYPLKSDEYELSVQFNPRLQAVFIQDRYGWNGEGLTDKHVKVDWSRAGVVEGKRVPLRYVEKTTILKRQDIV